MNRLGKRLEVIAGQVFSRRVADVGCDHGKLAKYLFDCGKVDYMVLSDISEPSLRKAIDLLTPKGYNCDYVCCDGLLGYDKFSIDECVISGMGGEEICSIIEKAKNADNLPENLVLQPMKNCEKVRVCALANGYAFFNDFVFKSAGKFYNLMVLKKGEDTLSDDEILFGRDNVKNPSADFKQMIEINYTKLCSLLKKGDISENVRTQILEKMDSEM